MLAVAGIKNDPPFGALLKHYGFSDGVRSVAGRRQGETDAIGALLCNV